MVFDENLLHDHRKFMFLANDQPQGPGNFQYFKETIKFLRVTLASPVGSYMSTSQNTARQSVTPMKPPTYHRCKHFIRGIKGLYEGYIGVIQG